MADPFPAPTIKQPHQCERKGTTYISTSSCLRSEQKPLLNSDSDSEVRIFGCFVLDPCGSACCATSLNQTYPRRSYTRSTALAASCPVASDSAGSPSKQVSAPSFSCCLFFFLYCGGLFSELELLLFPRQLPL